jgi:hypothetical protein
MKTENFIIISDQVKENLMSIIFSIPTDGKTKVTIGPSGTKSARQRGLQYIWYKEISKAGIGGKHEDTVEGVALVVKYRWVIPILCRDDEFFSDLYAMYKNKWKNDPLRMRFFVDTQVHTESLNTSQMAEVLTEIQNHYSPLVNLTDPQEGLL